MTSYLLGYFLPPDSLVGTMRGRKSATELRTPAKIGGARRLEVPIYVLMSGASASAAEFFAYSLATRGRATIVGEPSAGASNPYEDFDAGGGFRIGVPLEEPVDARSGKNWGGTGVIPDERVASGAALERAQVVALSGLLRTLNGPSARDARWALDALRTDLPLPAKLADYTGSYGRRTVRIDGANLVLERDRWPQRQLRFVGDDTFWIDGTPSSRVAFARDASGHVVALTELDAAGDVRRIPKDGAR